MAEIYKVDKAARKFLFEGVQGENEARSIQFDITPWTTELGNGAVTATAKRPTDAAPYPVTVTRNGNTVTWKPTSTDTAIDGAGMFQLEYTVNSVLAKTCIWSTMVAPSLDPAGDPPDPYDNWLADMRQVAADALQSEQNAEDSAEDAEAWAKGTKNGTPVSSTDAQYQNNAKYYSEESYKNAEAWAVGQRGGVDVPSTDPTYENNAKYYAEQSAANQYGAYIVKSASGNIASFADGADDVPMKSLKVAIVPKQAGSGDPSPDNVRPISGTSTANVHVTGKNMWSDVFSEWTTPTDYSVFKIPLEQGKRYTVSCRLTGTAVSGVTFGIVKKGNKYSEFVPPDPWRFIGNDGSVVNAQATYTIDASWTDPALIAYVASNAQTFQSVMDNYEIQIEEGTTATAYEPYTGTTTPVPLGQTVYGGTLDVVSGVLTIDRAMVDLGTLNWSVYQSSYSNFLTGGIASLAKQIPSQATYICSNYASYSTNGAPSTGDNYTFLNNNKALIIKDTAKASMTAADFKTAMSGVQLVYELATPTTVQLTPTQVATLLGTNNVWSDAGSVEVEYRADPTLAYNELANVIVSLGGNI